MSSPVTRLVVYRPKPGQQSQLEAILKRHGPVLRATGLLAPEAVHLYRAQDLRREGPPAEPYFVELFHWRDAEAAEVAHQVPEVMAVWETIGPHVQEMILTTLVAVA